MSNDFVAYCRFKKEDLAILKEKIDSSSSFALLAHSGADGDALSACFAMKLFLESLGKKAQVICPDKPKISEYQGYLVQRHEFEPEVVISLDTANKERSYFPKSFKNAFSINIDHHSSNTLYADLNLVEGFAASACEVLAVILKELYGQTPFSKKVSEVLLFGILDDSILFKTQMTSADTLKVASFLIQSGADFKSVKQKVSRKVSARIFKGWGKLFSLSKSFFKEKLLIFSVKNSNLNSLNLRKEDFAGFINTASNLVESEVVAFILEIKEGFFKVSTRSKDFDLNILASKFSGGGHKNAAGFALEEKCIQDVENKIVRALEGESF